MSSTASILSVGNELLLGEITDTNASFLASGLRSLGVEVVGIETAGDRMQDLVTALDRALRRSTLVLVTGGLGPTEDDLTAQALASTLGLRLVFREEVMQAMSERLKRPIEKFSESSRKQAWLPEGSEILRNDWGTAPGVHLKVSAFQGSPEEKHVFLMPGPPAEMKQVFGHRVLPILRQLSSGQAIRIKRFHAFGIPESMIGDRIKQWMHRGSSPDVGTMCSRGIVTVRVVAIAADSEQAEKILAPVTESIRRELSEFIHAEDEQTLPEITLDLLKKKRLRIALAESCTAGLACSKLAEVPGSSEALLGGMVVYSNESKEALCGVSKATLVAHGAVSEQTAKELAEGVRERFGADIGASVTGIAGPGGGTRDKPVGLVWFAVSTQAGTQTLERRYTGLDRNLVRDLAALQVIELIRKEAR